MRLPRWLAGRAEPLAWAAITAASLWLRSGFPKQAIGFAVHDDALFVHQARLLARGEWLGPYNNLTLAKGMFFSMFMAMAHHLAIPLNIAEQLLWLGAAALTARLVRDHARDRRLGLLVFAALAFNPIVFDANLARVVREGVYFSLSLLAVALLVLVAFPAGARRWAMLGRGVAFGLVAGAFWLTREEGPWLLPAFAVVLLAALPGLLRRRQAGLPSRRARLLPVALGLAASVAAFALVLGGVSAANWRHYRVFITNEFKAGPFLHAYGALSRINHDEWRRYVVLPKDARQRAYQVSPAARELAAVLDGPKGAAWRNFGCTEMRLADCTEIIDGWLMWAFRDAVAEAGHYGSGAEAMQFYERLGREIDAGCDAGAIPCGPPRRTLAPVFRREYIADTLNDLPAAGRIALEVASPSIGVLPSLGPRETLAEFADLVGDVAEAPGTAEFVSGWVASPSGRPSVLVRPRGEATANVEVTDAPAPDVAAALPGWNAIRFDLRADCPPAECDLIIAAPGVEDEELPLSAVHPGIVETMPTLRLAIDAAGLRVSAQLTTRRQMVQWAIARAIGRGYAAAAPVLCGVAAIGLLLAAARHRARPVPAALLGLALASAAAVAARTLLLAYLDVTSIPSARVLYTAATTPFVILFAVLGCWYGVRAVWPARWR